MRYTQHELDELQEQLYTAVLSDIMDDLGIHDFSLSGEIRPTLNSGKLIGYARTLYSIDVFSTPEKPYQKELILLDDLKAGDVLFAVVAGNNHNGFVGELIATACIARGSRGTVVDGYVRDTAFMDLDRFPVYARGTSPLDSKGRVDTIEIDEPVRCENTRICSGDIIFADSDGIIAIPADMVEIVFNKAMEKVRGENIVRDELRNGCSIVEVFNRYGIL